MSEVEQALEVILPILQAVNKQYQIDLNVNFSIRSKPSVEEVKAQAEVSAQQMNSLLYVKTLENVMKDPSVLASLRGAGTRTETEKPAE